MTTPASMLEEIKGLVTEQLQAVSYKWLARKYGIPVNNAKQLLYIFLEQNRKIAKGTFLLAGWTKEEPRRHVIRLVDAGKVVAVRATLEPLTSYHAYSVQPSQPQDAAALSNTDYVQLEELFQELLRSPAAAGAAANCLADNRLSGVTCPAAVRDASLARRPTPAAVAGPAAGAAAAPAAAGAAAGGVAVKEAGAKAGKPKASSAPARASSGDTPAVAAKPAANGAKAGSNLKAPGSKAASAASHLSGLWNKAPPKKEKASPPEPASGDAQAPEATKGGKAKPGAAKPRPAKRPAPAADADAALRAAQEDAESSDDDDDFQPGSRGVSKRAHVLEDDSDASPAKPAARAPGARRTVMDESSDDDEDVVPMPAGSNAGENIEVALDSDDDVEEVKGNKAMGKGKAPASKAKAAKAPAKRKGKAAAAAKEEQADAEGDQHDAEESPKAGRVKMNNSQQGSKRRKVMKTTYNDKGEEITEMVWEDVDEPRAPADAEPSQQAEAVPTASGGSGKALKERPANGTAAAKAAGAVKKPSAAAAQKKGSGAGAKASGKGKAASAGQRGIMSFFNKK